VSQINSLSSELLKLMKSGKNRAKRVLIIVLITVVSFIFIVIAFISPISKYLIEKYSKKYTSRQIRMDWIFVNPFTGYAHIHNLRIYDQNDDTLDLSAESFSIRFALSKMLLHTYEITSATLDKPWIRITRDKTVFNFKDVVDHFRSEKGYDTTETKHPVHFNMRNLEIKDGEFHYVELNTPVNYFVKNVFIETKGKDWNEDTMRFDYSFQSGPGQGGDAKGYFSINTHNLDYTLRTIFSHFDLVPFEQYLHELTNYGTFRGNLDANVISKGNFKRETDVDSRGILSLNDFHIGKTEHEDYASFDKVTIQINDVDPDKHIYRLDSLVIVHPYFVYEEYDYLNNIERMFGENGSHVKQVEANPAKLNLIIKIADYVIALSQNFFESDFKINRVAVSNADFKFSDFTTTEKFSIETSPFYAFADSIYKSRDRVHFFIKSGIKPYGNAVFNLSINPKNTTYFDLNYKITDIPIATFNPYIIKYTSFPFDRGTVELTGNWNVKNASIQSENHLLIIDPFTGKRLKNKGTKWIPLPLIMTFIRERGNVIDYEIPVTGSLKNPEFHLYYVFMDLLKNIFIKPVTIPYGIHVKSTQRIADKSIILQWEIKRDDFSPVEKKFVRKIAEFLSKYPAGRISVHPVEYAQREKEFILFFEAKKKYYLLTRNKQYNEFDKKDSTYVERMSNKDSLFVKYLNRHVATSLMFTIQEKCSAFVGESLINAKYSRLVKDRESQFMSYFKSEGVANRVKLYPSKNEVPYNGLSYYQVDYNGDNMPEELRTAYDEMNEINGGIFRKKYKELRKTIQAKYDKQASRIGNSSNDIKYTSSITTININRFNKT